MKVDGEMAFSSGRKRYANCGLVSVADDLSEVKEGYDGPVWDNSGADEMEWKEYPGSCPEDAPLTDADLVELADCMIERWTRFRAAHANG